MKEWRKANLLSFSVGISLNSKRFVAYSGRLPPALDVLGTYLFERTISEWESALSKLKIIPNDQIQKKLKLNNDDDSGLVELSLVKVDKNKLQMHDLLHWPYTLCTLAGKPNEKFTHTFMALTRCWRGLTRQQSSSYLSYILAEDSGHCSTASTTSAPCVEMNMNCRSGYCTHVGAGLGIRDSSIKIHSFVHKSDSVGKAKNTESEPFPWHKLLTFQD
ncbi:hypothetical protein CR513_15923, partial [Mucuna pruriens]